MNEVIKLEQNRYEYRGVRFGRNSKNKIVITISTPDSMRTKHSLYVKNLNEAKSIIDTKLESYDVIAFRLTVKAGA